MSTPRSRPQSTSPRRSPRASPTRKPLHERSESQANQQPAPVSADIKDRHVYTKDPFPRLPSQILAPRGRPYIFEDRTVQVPGTPPSASADQPWPSDARTSQPHLVRPRLQVTAKDVAALPAFRGAPRWYNPSENTSHVQPRKSIERERRRIKEAAIVSSRRASGNNWTNAPNAGSASNPATPLATSPTPNYAAFPSRPTTSFVEVQPMYGRELRPLNTPPSSHEDAAADEAELHPESQSDISAHSFSELPPTTSPRPRSITSVGSDSPRLEEDVRPARESFDAPRGRARSLSNPSSPKNASHQAALAYEAKLQYAKMRAPSGTEMTVTQEMQERSPSPNHQRILRKKANSNLQRAAIEDAQVFPRSAPTITRESVQATLLRPKQSVDSIASYKSSRIPPIPAEAKAWITGQQPPARANRVSGFSDEMIDSVPELQAPRLKHQRSAFSTKAPSEHRPESLSSGPSEGSFYNFLNSSIATWAKAYYRNGEGARLYSPSQRSVAPPTTATSFRSHLQSSGTSGPSSSPVSEDFPSQIFIPRVRPLQSQLQRYSSDENIQVIQSSHDSQSQVADENATPVIRVPARPRRIDVSSQYFSNPPRLNIDKRVSSMISAWRAPSFDEDLGILSRGNRQIILFCCGFIIPFAWMLAAFLPIPPRPQWRTDTFASDGESKPAGQIHASDDLFDPIDVRRFQKANWWRNANRVMSAFGLVVIAVVIACAVIATT